ncbi:NAD-dependent succinate-semialdehyde dehydrogenase [Gulosibacter molinativorax]|uniref:NAD-dependent succinate-semialdehyde dehydrogenase n=1 Tax=Gulosibacter molinativorax TaxID=256821 RepID=A0ABT7C6P1_9MICO|nr:NAD-dependent succinate-semialdehyde dehydrogenase [Gulosibacter molinativorax]MDJ1370863.1 NAD-dependent succinate-semialdehyde dehydrogenase [Gulosibacter molinativorax]QUY62200.1 Succinate-semialdehyde dehydrogenase [NAD] [Gulosibacter molinativorax]
MSNYKTINPATGELIREFGALADSEVEGVLARSGQAYNRWRRESVERRASVLARAAELFEERTEELAAVLTEEIGKTLAAARGEIKTVIGIFRYYSTTAVKQLDGEELDVAGPGRARLRLDPIGPLVGIMPWNFPYYQVARFAAPNLLLGNVIILKHASNCPQSAVMFESLLRDAGLPEDAYINVFASHDQVAQMIADDRVRGVSLTGSEGAGARTGELAGRHLKPVVLELGGSDPFIVLEDADIEKAAKDAVAGRLVNNGQTCTASKRFIVVDDVYDEFVEKFVGGMSQVPTGDPTDPATVLGPLSSESAVKDLEEFVADAVANGANVETGGERLEGPGSYYPATVLTGVTETARAYREELFGPVAVVYRVPDEQTAIELANDSPFGLSSSVYTSDVDRAERISAELEAGMVWVNSVSKSSAELPFGGVKRSGVGRELGEVGLTQFANQKLVRVFEDAN